MIFEYFADMDMLVIKLVDTASTESEEITPGVVLNFDEGSYMVGIEIEDASRRIDLSRLEVKAVPISNLILSERIPVG